MNYKQQTYTHTNKYWKNEKCEWKLIAKEKKEIEKKHFLFMFASWWVHVPIQGIFVLRYWTKEYEIPVLRIIYFVRIAFSN